MRSQEQRDVLPILIPLHRSTGFAVFYDTPFQVPKGFCYLVDQSLWDFDEANVSQCFTMGNWQDEFFPLTWVLFI